LEDKIVRVIPHLRASAAWNLALEEAIFLKAKLDMFKGREVQPVVRLYSFERPSVILGYRQRAEEVDLDFCREFGIDVTMRTTGGGSVLLGEKDLQYSLLLPLNYSKDLLKLINERIISSLQDVGFSPNLITKTGHPVIRLDGKAFVFDAQRRAYKNGSDLILHHGTTLVDNSDYENMHQALKATKQEIEDLRDGNVWIGRQKQFREADLVSAFQKNLPDNATIRVKDFTAEEIKLARRLYEIFYTNPEEIKSGKKKFGICYLPSTPYNMAWYTAKDKDGKAKHC